MKKLKEWWKKLEYWKKGGVIGLIVGIILGTSTILCALSNFGEGCLPLIVFWLFWFPFEKIFEKIPGSIAYAIFGYGFFIIEYAIVGALIGFIISKIRKK